MRPAYWHGAYERGWMQRRPDLVRSLQTPVVLGLAGLLALLALLLLPGIGSTPFDLPVRVVEGQQVSVLTPRLREVLDRSQPQERVPVLIELSRQEAPRPIGPDPEMRAARHAADLAALYGSTLQDVRTGVASDLAADLAAGELLWIGGAVALRTTPDRIELLADRPDVRTIYWDGLERVELAARSRLARAFPEGLGGLGTRTLGQDLGDGRPRGLEAVGAPELWATGATGEGAIIAIIDSGVDGEHPLLSRKWRGLSTSASEAWFDPWGLSDRPVDDNPTGGVGHGTIVATVALGGLGAGDTLIETGGTRRVVEGDLEVVTGVAPGAEWIAANAFEEFGDGTYTRRSILLQSMQWALDPDGDPITASDVPDAVNNSWGFLPGRCDGIFDRAIDALELAGIPVVFAAGNRTAGFDTVAAPANRADLLLNAFSVGAVRQRGDEFVPAENSLGGPSPCAPGAVKPEVAAPGVVPLVRALGPRTVQVLGGTGPFTSWAAPHASGALALLRGLNARASSDELKAALFSTSRDLPPPGLDNRSGAGLIDVRSAAGRVGGLGAVLLELSSWNWEPGDSLLTLDLRNRGDAPFPGGEAELRRRSGDEPLGRARAPAVGARGRATIRFADLALDLHSDPGFRLRLASELGVLDLPLLLRLGSSNRVQVRAGDVTLSLDASGRLGRVAGPVGLEFLGGDWLTAGAFLLADDRRVSDVAYVDVQGRSRLKEDPVSTDTDWSGEIVEEGGATATIAFDDRQSLRPMGSSVESRVQLVQPSDSGAFAVIRVTIDHPPGGGAPTAGLLLDWDFESGDRVLWDRGLRASVMGSAGSGGPWAALTTAPRSPTTHAGIPLGRTSAAGDFVVGSGLLAQPFTDEQKGRLLRLGAAAAPRAEATDWAQMVGIGPIGRGGSVTFVIAISATRAGLGDLLERARDLAEGGEVSVADGDGGLTLLPPFPNPFDPSRGQVVHFPYLVRRATGTVRASLTVHTIAGRLVHEERRELRPGDPAEPFRWDGRLDGGAMAASGVYGYILRVGDERQAGRFVLLK